MPHTYSKPMSHAVRAEQTSERHRVIQQHMDNKDKKRKAQPEEIAPAFVFMAVPCCSSYITGEILPVVGGYKGG